MIEKISKINYKDIKKILNEYDSESFFEKVNVIPECSDVFHKLEKMIDVKNLSTKSVLGIDIYRYSSYEHFEQTLIPFIFKILFQQTIRMCLNNNQFIFQNDTKTKIERGFVSAGDGGFLILDTPLHALIFAINFELNVRAYNSFHLYPKLKKIIGHLSLRYAITTDKIFYFDNNFYGRAIINNARILAKDNLNRCLIDQATFEWFLLNTDGIENLQIITINEIANIFDFQKYDNKYIENKNNFIFGYESNRNVGIINSDILKIGKIQSKDTDLDIYNLHLQVAMRIFDTKNKRNVRIITISLGNLNTAGI